MQEEEYDKDHGYEDVCCFEELVESVTGDVRVWSYVLAGYDLTE